MLLSSAAFSADLETLLMPGKLTAAHAKLEGDCSSCHDRSNRARQASLCAGCHKPILEDLQRHKGFHGRLQNATAMQCSGCHQEHQGRDADIVKFVPEQFNHAKTDFDLQGAHSTVPCVSCHVPGKKYREAPNQCSDCHRRDDAHGGKLGEDCGACHVAESWPRTRFDHARTRFALLGRHQQVDCAACHIDNRFKGTSTQCASCHAPDDVHRGSRGGDCASCHNVEGWKSGRFDHARASGFSLLGAHSQAACGSCHRSGRMEDPLPTDCQSCHRSDDAHEGRMGARCERCHGPDKWINVTFDHMRDTKFELLGAHQKTACHACHTANLADQKLSGECVACHRASDVHRGQLGTQCDTCHVPDGWRHDVHFDHDLTDFPLLGLHIVVPCESCHITRAFKDVQRDCNSCHRADDRHKGSLGSDCETCHSPNGWGIWDFDHQKATGFALAGAHGKLICGDCHRKPPTEAHLSSDCYACHSKDDPHLGQFGRQCQRCHSTISFRKVSIR